MKFFSFFQVVNMMASTRARDISSVVKREDYLCLYKTLYVKAVR